MAGAKSAWSVPGSALSPKNPPSGIDHGLETVFHPGKDHAQCRPHAFAHVGEVIAVDIRASFQVVERAAEIF